MDEVTSVSTLAYWKERAVRAEFRESQLEKEVERLKANIEPVAPVEAIPREPTKEMLAATSHLGVGSCHCATIWKAMYDAAPLVEAKPHKRTAE